jgi:hypothetical protein
MLILTNLFLFFCTKLLLYILTNQIAFVKSFASQDNGLNQWLSDYEEEMGGPTFMPA